MRSAFVLPAILNAGYVTVATRGPRPPFLWGRREGMSKASFPYGSYRARVGVRGSRGSPGAHGSCRSPGVQGSCGSPRQPSSLKGSLPGMLLQIRVSSGPGLVHTRWPLRTSFSVVSGKAGPKPEALSAARCCVLSGKSQERANKPQEGGRCSRSSETQSTPPDLCAEGPPGEQAPFPAGGTGRRDQGEATFTATVAVTSLSQTVCALRQ